MDQRIRNFDAAYDRRNRTWGPVHRHCRLRTSQARLDLPQKLLPDRRCGDEFLRGLIAFYIVLKSLGLINTFGVYVIPGMLNLFFLLIAITFFTEIPEELGESARIDGASEVRIFTKIILPVSMPLLATMSLFIGSGQWNAWLDSAYFVQDEGLRTLTYRMMQVINQTMVPSGEAQSAAMSRSSVTPFSIQATAMVVSIVPILGVYPFLQKYFVSGMMLGSVKG